MHINPTSLTVNQLFGSNNEQYVIPTYQRRYSWQLRQVWELIDDIKLIEGGDTHLLGSVVCLAGHHTAGLNKLELVDGQQRLTTVSILLECIRQRLETLGEVGEANALSQLLYAKPLGGLPVRKLALDSIDSDEFARHVASDDSQSFVNAQLAAAFETVRVWVADQSLEKLAAFLYRLKNQAIFIRLDVSDAKDAFKLFETINNRGLRLSPTDIIKNFLLGNAARFGGDKLDAAKKAWTLVLKHLDGANPDAFFRYFLMATLTSNVRAAEVIPYFKRYFMTEVTEAAKLPERHLYLDVPEELDGEEDAAGDDEDGQESSAAGFELVAKAHKPQLGLKDFLGRLVLCAEIFGQLVLAKTVDKRINRRLRNLRMIKAIQSYGFLMHLRAGGCPDKAFLEVLQLTEAFVLRRHTCRERTNETERLFARMCAVDPTSPVAATRQAYRDLCPTDEKFESEFAAASFPPNLIDRARYCLERFEASEHGEYEELQVLGAEDVHVEHIIPQKIKSKKAKDEYGDWVTYLGNGAEAQHPRYVGRIGNLTLFAGALNIGASNNPFHRKRAAYKESAIRLTQTLSAMQQFKYSNVDKRSKELAAQAVVLWPMP